MLPSNLTLQRLKALQEKINALVAKSGFNKDIFDAESELEKRMAKLETHSMTLMQIIKN
jgi:hypothetical protein